MLDRCLLARLASLVVLGACASAPPPTPDRFGVVALTAREQLPCATFSTAAAPGERVEIVLLPSREELGAKVASAIAACGVGQEPGHAYRLELDRAADQVFGSIAVRGTLPPSVSLRQCAGSETLHLTAWMAGRRIWHGSYYLGYDVEPDCGAGDID